MNSRLKFCELNETDEYNFTENDGYNSKIVYKKENNILYYKDAVNFEKTEMSFNKVNSGYFTKIKNVYKPTPNEMKLFDLFPSWVRWVGVEEDGKCVVFARMPTPGNGTYYNGGNSMSFDRFFHNTITLTFKDGPYQIR